MKHALTSQHKYLQTRLILDALLVALAMVFAYTLRFVILDLTGWLPVEKNYEPRDYVILFAYAFPVTMTSFVFCGLYGLRDPVFNYSIGMRVVRGTLLGMSIVIALNFFVREAEYARPVFMAGPVSVVALVIMGRLLLRKRVERRLLAKKLPMTQTLVIGCGEAGRAVVDRIRQHPEWGLEVPAIVVAHPEEAPADVAGVPVVGGIDDIRPIVRERHIRRAIFAQPDLSASTILELMLELEKEMVESRFVPSFFESHLTDCSFENLDGLPLFALKGTPLHGINLVIKGLFDKAVTTFALILGAPALLLIAFLIWRYDGFPILYKQKRLAMDGRRFNMYKFRTMRTDAEKHGPGWTKPDDDRVTPIGKILRRWNLDELPQLFNVWRGDMSLVGPRPERPEWVKQFREQLPHYMMRHTVRSGMTGWAQVNGLRGDCDLNERLEADLYYIENWTLWLDIKILVMTLKATKNAY